MRTLFAFAATVLLATGFTGRLPAQLAITEIMAQSSTNGLPFLGPDFWELTNFGDNDVNLDGYGIHDDRVGVTPFTDAFNGLTIHAGESIIFCRSNGPAPFIRSPEEFKAWWGENNLPTNLQVRFYVSPGLDENEDQFWLKDRAGNVVDMVTFGASLPGRSMIHDPETGAFGFPSAPGVQGAFRSARVASDVGSPGFPPVRVRMRVLQQPASQTVDGCGGVQFSVLAGGMPGPMYQWTSNGIPIAGATGPKLTLPDIGPWSAGEYRVRLSNGFDELFSDPATLVVNTNPLAPWFMRTPIDVTVFPGQTGRFAVEIRGYPCADFHWRSNGISTPGENGRTLAVAVPQYALPGTILYTLTVSNAVGTATASARLVVMRLPCLQITEVMAWPTNDSVLGHNGWFELTNCDTNEVNLQGYRFRDTDLPDAAFVITEKVIIQPGESVIFVESMSRAAFVQWWGVDQLPPDLQVVTWRGWGLSKTSSDTIHLWNSSPSFSANTVATLSLLDSFPGFSQETYSSYDEVLGSGANFLRESVLWEYGAFPAAIGGDIGSPGYTTNPPPRLLTVTLNATGVEVRCRVVAGKSYRLSSKGTLQDPAWTPRGPELVATGPVLTLPDTPPASSKTRFYRVEELP
jgi:hypothetical protein